MQLTQNPSAWYCIDLHALEKEETERERERERVREKERENKRKRGKKPGKLSLFQMGGM